MLSENELNPWLVIVGSGEDRSPACWRITATQETALALFSTQAKAERYGLQHASATYELIRPEQASLLQVFIDAYRSGMRQAVLDPDSESARSIFDLRSVLKAAKELLRSE